MQKKLKAGNRYTVDNSNRLVIKSSRRKLIANGRFSLDADNRLSYWLNEPLAWRTRYNLPGRIAFEGKWQLNPNYDLELVLDEAREQFKGDRLVLKGEIISTNEDALVFEMVSYKKGLSPTELRRSCAEGTVPESSIRLLKLSGFWKADEANRLNFVVKKKVLSDTLVFKGAWQINRNQQVEYTYEKTDLKTKTKALSTLIFSGFWQISSSNQLTYIISKSTNSKFDFRVQIETPNVYPKKGVIKYRIGIGLREITPGNLKVISLYGVWKFSRAVGLIFEMEYAKREFHSLEFGAEVNFAKNNQASFKLMSKDGQDLGIEVIFTHRFLNELDAELFLKLKKVKEENAVEAGVRIPF